MKKGISIISLIITIIVIIILAATVIFSGFNSPDNANFAKFTAQIQDFQSAIDDEFLKRKTNYHLSNEYIDNSHIFFSIATGMEFNSNTDLTLLDETIALSDLYVDILPNTLDGEECYLVTKGIQFSGKKDEKGLYTDFDSIEKHYITDKGEFFILPGYPYNNGGETRWYINSSKYYESSEPVSYITSAGDGKKIVFNANGGTVSEKLRIKEEGQEIGTLPIPKRTGYLFDDWYTKAEGGDKIAPTTLVGNESKIYYAHWTPAAGEVNGVPCLTFTDVINTVPKNGEETVVKVYSDIQEDFTIDTNQNIVFDLQGHTLINKSDSPIITNNGNISLTNGDLNTTSASHAVINNTSSGTVIISSGNIISNGNRQAIYNNGGRVEISGTAYLSSNSDIRPTVTNISGGTLIITGGTIISAKKQAISNEATMIIGKKDGSLSVNSPIIQGATYGISSSTGFYYYDGTIRGITKAIENESRIQQIETDAYLKHNDVVIDDLNYKIVYLSNEQKDYNTVYEYSGDYVFNGTNNIEINQYLFSENLIHKDFSISFVIKNFIITNEKQPTMINIKDESGAPYNGVAYRLGDKTTALQYSAKGGSEPINYGTLGNISENMKVLLERKDDVVYLWQNDELISKCDYSGFTSYFNIPITIGSSYKNGSPFRYFKGTLSNIKIRVEK